jgi:proteasome lid subunit RPN8/RPN11
MVPAQSSFDAGIWSVPGHAPVVEYSRSVLNDILGEVVDAFGTYLSGGYEVGGILLGTRQGKRVSIFAHKRLEIRPHRPSFILSEPDEKRLTELMRSTATDPAFAGMEVVGWYHSHTRSEIFLSEADVEIFDRHFPEPWQVAMVLHPSDLEPVRIGFFFREEDGFIRTDQSYLEIAVEAPPSNRFLRQPAPWPIGDDGEPVQPEFEIVAPPEESQFELPPEPERPSTLSRMGGWLLLAGAIAAVAAGAGAILVLRQPDPPLGLSLTATEGELLVRWDLSGPAFEKITDAVLRIRDGSAETDIKILPNASEPPSGRTYRPKTSRVDVHLTVNRSYGKPIEEHAIYVAHPRYGMPAPEVVEAESAAAEAERAYNEAQAETVAIQDRNKSLELATEDLQARLEAAMERRRREAADAQQRAEASRKLLASPPPRVAVPAKDLPSAPELTASRSASANAAQSRQASSLPVTAPPRSVQVPPPAPAPAPAAPPPRQAQTSLPPLPGGPIRQPAAPSAGGSAPASVATPSPQSGRLIWTGELPRNGILTLDGGRASAGALIGQLPGVPVRISAYPATLSDRGLRVHTGNTSFTQPRLENPSASNAWNRTEYVYDPKVYRELIVEQVPSAAEPRRLALRAGGRNLSVIVIEWQVLPQ